MGFPIPSHRIHEIVRARKCVQDGKPLEVTDKGRTGKAFDELLDLVDGPFIDLRYLGKASDARGSRTSRPPSFLLPTVFVVWATTPLDGNAFIRIEFKPGGIKT